ncbi:hypothetical protein [Enterococcus faecalis]|uniref:hypothetical protein n=1 Tax=Enterococcus faecalis TaxID=1351 RepID=UPI001F25327E|nr:hypothetical protein [Enterococcus faecalis]BDC77843.1 hypothetical protein EFK4_27460 [Enterococcus faecalis]
MLTTLRVYKEGFNESIKIGESLEHAGDKYIVIRILELKKLYFSNSVRLAKLAKIGKIIFSSDKKMAYEVISINSIHYEFVELVVEYTAQMIVPWSEQEINKALLDERKSTFKVLEGGL